MIGAFQRNAFQNSAFQVGPGPDARPGAGHARRRKIETAQERSYERMLLREPPAVRAAPLQIPAPAPADDTMIFLLLLE